MEAVTTTHNGLVKEDGKMVSVHFDSIVELLDYKCENTNASKFKEYIYGESSQSSSWIGKTNSSNKDVINHALGGDSKMCEDLLEKIAAFREQIGADRVDFHDSLPKIKRKRIKSDFGDSVDIHKVYQGQLDTAWDRMIRVESPKTSPLVTLCIDICGSSMENCTDSFWRAAVALHVSNELQSAGKSVKIVVAECAEGAMRDTHKLLSNSIVIKDFNQQVAIERIAAMTHFGFLRTYMFGVMCVQDYACYSHLGSPADLTEENMPIHLREEIETGHVKFLHIGRVRGSREAEMELKKIYKRIGDYKN